MAYTRRYLLVLTAWSVGLTLLFLLMGVTGPGGQGMGAWQRVPALLGFAMALSAFPAGVSVSRSVLSRKEGLATRCAIQGALAFGATLVMFLIVTSIAPRALASGGEAAWPEVARMTSTQLIEAGRVAQSQASAAGVGRVSDWLQANTIAWEHDRRWAHAALPFLLTWVGMFAAYWAGRAPRRELRLAMLWGMGLFIVLTLYLAGENSFELIALRAGGPAFFAASLIGFVPMALFGTLGWTTAMDLLGTEDAPA